MCGDKRSVDRTRRDFLAAWGRGYAGPIPCGACTACCHYPGIVVDEKRDRKRLAHLLTERSPDGELVLQRRRTEPAFISVSGDAPSISSGPRFAAPSTAASSPRWALSSAAAPITKRRVGSSPGVRERTTKPGAVERDAARPTVSCFVPYRGVGSKLGSRTNPRFLGAIGKERGPPFKAVSSPIGRGVTC
jgi:hypothetical protein